MLRTQPPLNRFLTYGLALAAAVGLVLGLAGCTQPGGDGGVRPSAGASSAKPAAAKPKVASKAGRSRTATRRAGKPTTAKPKVAATAKATPAPAVRNVSYPSLITSDDRGQ